MASVAKMAGTIARSPQARAIARSILRSTGQAIKARRTNRINAGKRVAGWRTRNALLKMGVPLPIAAPNVKKSMPVNIGQVRGVQPPTNDVRTGNETALAIAGATASVFTSELYTVGTGTVNCKIYPLYPRDPNLWPGLYAFTQSWVYFKFSQLAVTFTTQAPTSARGKIGLGICPSYEIATNLNDWSDFEALPNKVIGSVYMPSALNITPDMMNTQFTGTTTGFKLAEPTGTDYYDSSYNQGFLVIAVTDCADTSIIGKVSLAYRCQVLRPVAPLQSGSVTDVWFGFNAGGDAEITLAAYQHALALPSHYVNTDYAYTAEDTGVGETTITGASRTPYVVLTHIFGAAFPTLVFAAVSDCVVTHLYTAQSTDLTMHVYYHLVAPSSPGHTFTVTQTNDATNVHHQFYGIHKATAKHLVDWAT